MAMQVVSRGKPIATGDAVERGRFEDHAFGAYARLNEERREILQQIVRDGTVHGR